MHWVEQFFDDPFFAEDFELMKHEKDLTEREAQFIIAELGLQPVDNVLDFACGFGRHVLAIAPRVNAVTGTDRTESYIELARQQAKKQQASNVSFRVLDMRGLDYEAEFDAAYNYFNAWGYYDNDTNLDVLKRAYRSLKPGGRFLLEFMHRDGEMRRFTPRSWVRRDDGVLVLYERRLDFTAGRFYMKHIFIAGGQTREIEIDHQLPTSDEFVRLFQHAGFSNIRIVSAPDGGDVGITTSRIAVIGIA